jgi:uncharacterized membrane protein
MTSPLERVGGWGLDLYIVAALTLVAIAVLLSPLHGSSVAILLGVPFLLFVPGYAVVAALFPEQPFENSPRSLGHHEESPGWLLRIALSLVASALVVGVLGLALSWFLTISLLTMVGAITAVTVCSLVVAGVRRGRVPAARRADPFDDRSTSLLPGGTRRQSITLGIAIAALLLATVFVGVTPVQGEDYSEAYLLTETAEGESFAESYPSTFVAGEGHELSLALSNHEHETVDYEVVVVAQRVGPEGDVTAREQVDRFGATLDHGETSVLDRQIAPTMTGEDIRLRFLVYEGTTPGNGADADHMLQLWIDVEDAE